VRSPVRCQFTCAWRINRGRGVVRMLAGRCHAATMATFARVCSRMLAPQRWFAWTIRLCTGHRVCRSPPQRRGPAPRLRVRLPASLLRVACPAHASCNSPKGITQLEWANTLSQGRRFAGSCWRVPPIYSVAPRIIINAWSLLGRHAVVTRSPLSRHSVTVSVIRHPVLAPSFPWPPCRMRPAAA